ncbi:hypothetical protein D9615_007641 [Tricholomella constricta]|uniref:Uncharacterized protein n=1 Tax=Tricholomella constricta TaxID=117010 RepID=A0A8H5H7B7_9AGAR|nr:hypothetical protein D9615_007641 [Tricholomella constricta]
MLSRFHSLFSFSFSNDEKSSIYMATTKIIPGVIPQDLDNQIYISQWEDKLVKSRDDLCDRLDDLRGCRVRSIRHCRAKGSAVHELVIVEVRSGDDHRFMRLERLNKKEAGETTSEQKKRTAREIVGLRSGNHDRVKWTSTLKTAMASSKEEKPYLVVQTLTFPNDFTTIGVIDVIALATAITSSAQNYSLFAHMCLWWAAIFFECFKKRTINHDGVQFAEGPLYAERGNILKVNFVDADCKLLATGLTVKTKETLVDRYSAEETEQFLVAFENDSQLAVGDLAENPVDTMMKRWDISGKKLTASLKAAVDAAIAERDALKIANAALATERAERVAEREELHASLAAERAERSKKEQQTAQLMADMLARIKSLEASHSVTR